MLALSFKTKTKTKTKTNDPYLLLVTIFCFFALTACAALQSKIESSYTCELTKLTICDTKNHNSCTDISSTDFIEEPYTIFYPDTLAVHSYEGNKLIEKYDIKLWRTFDKTIFMAGNGVDFEGNATVWSGAIRGDNNDLIVSAFSLDYDYTLLGSCKIQ